MDEGSRRGRDSVVGEGRAMTMGEAVERYNEMKLITVGCEKGTIVFISCSEMSRIYCRLTYHR